VPDHLLGDACVSIPRHWIAAKLDADGSEKS